MWFGTMSHIKTSEDLHTSVGELASLMNDTFTCCKRNYEALMPYIGKKETNINIYHKLVQVNMLLNKLSEQLTGLRVEFLTVPSYEQRRETILPGDMKKRKSDEQELSTHETKNILMEVPFSNKSKCCIALTSETEMNTMTENVVLMDSEETSHTQLQKKMDMNCMRNIKTEIHDSNDDEVLLLSPIGDTESSAAQTLIDTIQTGVTVSLAGDKKSRWVADKLVTDNACGKTADMISQRKNVEECFMLERYERETRNQENCEDIDSIFSKDHVNHRGSRGEADSSTSFSHQARTPFNIEERPIAFTVCDSDKLLQGKLNKVNKEKKQALGVQSWEQLYNDELYGIIRLQNGKYRCTWCWYVLKSYKVVLLHVKSKKHKEKRIITENNSYNSISDVPSNGCESEIVNYQKEHGLVKGKIHKRKQMTDKDRCTTEWEITGNSCENKHVITRQQKNYKRKQKTAKKNCSKKSKLQITAMKTNLSGSVGSLKDYKRKQITDKNSCAKESKIANNNKQCRVM